MNNVFRDGTNAPHDDAAEHFWEHEHDSAEHAGEYVAEPPYQDHGEALPSRRTSRVSKRVRKRRRSLVFLIILVMFAAVVYFAVQAVRPMLGGFTVADYPGPGTGSVQIVVSAGATGRTVAGELKTKDVVASEQAFLDALTAADGSGSLQPGTFSMKLQMKAADAVTILLATSDEKVHYAAVAQNLRINDTLAVLAKSTGIAQADFDALAKQPQLFELPAQAKNLEGYLAPGEYRFPIELDAKGILTQMVTATKKSLTDTGITDPAEQYRVLIIASIIEFEGNEANYAKISGAIENRINNPNGETGGRLESDATVAYGLGLKTYNLTAEQKADKTNLYNTFALPGLPVGPIGSPGIKAIEAAAHPETNPYYFWVTVDLKTGETLYAATFAEHQMNVTKYVAWCEANPGECK
ncbi:endolytic transglycosylase MltG [Arthrobacter glacialis]|uniref:endolytic transglycosylase MltG n=1 Tax=Arthrobacter glacialis TaxID=1664 RepID=UPI000CD3E404|nr:endolytic transglycosylase MltG [Arthrobacter glacialis]POH58780.1 endolytic transglycosylase MltG [Arthrobacter glacialis]